MATFSFDLLLLAKELTDEIADALHEAGCDDATPWAEAGVVFLSFDREADSLVRAVVTAVEQVRAAGIDVREVRLDDSGSLVNAKTLANRLGISRETTRKWANGELGPGHFPAPLAQLEGGQRLWRWEDVALWLQEHREGLRSLERSEALDSLPGVHELQVVSAVNAALSLARSAEHLGDALPRLLGPPERVQPDWREPAEGDREQRTGRLVADLRATLARLQRAPRTGSAKKALDRLEGLLSELERESFHR